MLEKSDAGLTQITIRVPFDAAAKLTPVWARGERGVDFRDPAAAARTTTAFAATELKQYLEKTFDGVRCVFSETTIEGCCISLEIADFASRDSAFELIPHAEGLTVRGTGRTGLLHGVYEFLRLQGYRWYYPGPMGEVFHGGTAPVFPTERVVESPAMTFSRAFDVEYASMESAELVLWMARNRMNVTTWRADTGPLCEKLGFTFKAGGHIFEEMLDPDRPMPSGRSLWAEHEEWFGLPEDGQRVKEHAQRVQFCVCADGLIDFLGAELLALLDTVYARADRIDVWGFDTWGGNCNCARCRAVGNGADITLHLASGLRRCLDHAGRGDIKLIVCAYEGTGTLEPPGRPVPENLRNSGDSVVFYPIDRCYAHPMDGDCARNRRYRDCLLGWLASTGCPPLIVGEYYNVSKYEDLPLVLADSIAADIPFYARAGVAGMTYMHVPMVNWGVRALTNCLYARMMCDPVTDAAALRDTLLRDLYGSAATLMRGFYDESAACMRYVASWRAWNDSILGQLLRWDGGRPEKPLQPDCHHADIDALLTDSHALLHRLEQAGELLEQARALCRTEHRPPPPTGAVNPREEAAAKQTGHYFFNVCEALRGYRYARDVWGLMYWTAAYHTALFRQQDDATERCWAHVDALLTALESYYLPMSYEFPGTGLESRSADDRSQLAVVVARARAARTNT